MKRTAGFRVPGSGFRLTRNQKVLLLGYGNPGRGDDGLGPALVEAVERLTLPNLTALADYQLNPEYATDAAQHDVVIFADAAMDGPEPFSWRILAPRTQLSFTSHSMQAAEVLALAEQLCGRKIAAYLLGIRGYKFEQFKESLTRKARSNLQEAVRLIEGLGSRV